MNSQQKQQIGGLVKKYSDSGTESLIAYVAETNGMLAACQALLHSIDAEGSAGTEWLQQECSAKDVTFHLFLQEVKKIIALFHPGQDVENHYDTLGVSAGAGLDEIKQAYRTLSLRYHPDTASPPYRNNPEKFIAINKAYNALLHADTTGEKEGHIPQEKQWRRKKERTVSPEQRKKVFTWTLGLLLVLVVISVIASMDYKKRAMLAGLQESRGAFIPPARKIAAGPVDEEPKFEIQPVEIQPVENQPTARPPLTTEKPAAQGKGTEIKVQPEPEISETKVQAEPEVVSSGIEAKETPQKEVVETVASPVPAGEIPKVAPSSSPTPVLAIDEQRKAMKKKETAAISPRPVKAPSQEVDSRQNVNAEPQTVAKEQTSKKQPDVVISTVLAPADVHPPDGKTEKEVELAGATVGKIIQSPVAAPSQTQAGDKQQNLVTNTVLPSAVHPPEKKTEKKVGMAGATVAKITPLPGAAPTKTEKSPEGPNLQTRVDRFFADYVKAYEKRNLILFARFFDASAEENDKPFTSMMATYLDLFAATRQISFRVEQRTWRQVDGMVAVDGRFKVDLKYEDGRTVSGSGPIHFLLVENDGELSIKKMNYVFK